MCQLCGKHKCVSAVLIWERPDSYKTDGLYICANCKKMYEIMGYNRCNTMNWAEYLMEHKYVEQ